MRLSFSTLTPEVRAIRKLFEFAGLEVEVDPSDKEHPELEVGDCVVVGWKSVLVYAGRVSHALPSDALAAAVVMQWVNIEAPDDDAAQEDVERLLRLVEAEFDKHDGDFLCDHTLNRSSAADFLWKERLTHVKATWDVDWAKYPRVSRFLECDPAVDARDDDGDQSEDERPETPGASLVRADDGALRPPPACLVC